MVFLKSYWRQYDVVFRKNLTKQWQNFKPSIWVFKLLSPIEMSLYLLFYRATHRVPYLQRFIWKESHIFNQLSLSSLASSDDISWRNFQIRRKLWFNEWSKLDAERKKKSRYKSRIRLCKKWQRDMEKNGNTLSVNTNSSVWFTEECLTLQIV